MAKKKSKAKAAEPEVAEESWDCPDDNGLTEADCECYVVSPGKSITVSTQILSAGQEVTPDHLSHDPDRATEMLASMIKRGLVCKG